MNHTTVSADVAANVRAALARRRIQQQEFAETIGWPRIRLSRRINGHTQFTIDDVVVIADALGVSVETLVGKEQAVSA